MTVRLTYDLPGAGWADCTIVIDGQALRLSASYLSDALDDLTGAVIAVLRGEECASAVFSEEPGEYRWELWRVGVDRLRLRIFWSLPRWGDGPHDPAEPIFDATCRLRTFGGQLLSELQRLLREHGEDGYRAKWVLYDFPMHRFTTLASLLK
ncbi:MAG: hypothetical protein MUF00_21555 [Gemmatimonadaceae bacterium]|jgi:hypothetical protein|nr:hypothetical protein [Gemmatimonadaceae bacterium]